VRLQRDARFPWLILLPRVVGATELTDLTRDHAIVMVDEIALASAAVKAMGEAIGRPVEKLNVAAIGNVTAQLHVHVVGRRRDDGVWPDPVWGRGTATAYEDIERVRTAALKSFSGS
jgi:diadenosine tetraphosphate (Ap4A) HIT family hydrolase